MVNYIPSPDLLDLLPPLLAHLPLGYSSPKPPPSLLPLLSPILRSRLQLLEGTEESWLALLTWSATNSDGGSLVDHLKQQDLNPHYSGEVEIGDYDLLGIKRVDPEMLEARAVLHERRLLVRFVWVPSDAKDETEGWKVLETEVLHGEGYDEGDEGNWFSTVEGAEAAFSKAVQECQKDQTEAAVTKISKLSVSEPEKDEDDDADYWARYDCGGSESPDPSEMMGNGPSEDDYYSRYGQVESQIGPGTDEPEVPRFETFVPGFEKTKQPIPQYSLSFHSNMVSGLGYGGLTAYSSSSQSASDSSTPPTAESLPQAQAAEKTPVARSRKQSDASESASSIASETGIKQHISTSIKSLYRLARSGGIDNEEFQRLVKVELGLLSMMDLDNE